MSQSQCREGLRREVDVSQCQCREGLRREVDVISFSAERD